MSSSFLNKDHSDESMGERKSFAYLWKFTQGNRKEIYSALALLMGSSILITLSTFLFSLWIDQGIRAQNLSLTYKLTCLILFLELLSVAALYIGRRLMAHSSLKSIFEMRKQLFEHLQKLPMKYFDHEPVGRTLTRLTHDVENIESFFGGTCSRMMQALFTLCVVITGMFLTHWKLAFFMTLSLLPAFYFSYYFRTHIRLHQRNYSKGKSSVLALLAEYIQGLFTIRSLGKESWTEKRYDERVDHFLKSAIKINTVNSYVRPLILFLSVLPLPVLLLLGIPWIQKGLLSIGLLITFVRYAERFSRPLFHINHELHVVQAAFASAERIAIFFKEKEEQNSSKLLLSKNHPLSIEYKNLSLSYDKEKTWALKDINLKISEGEHCAFVGASGSGKTSCIALLSRLYDFQKGSLLVNGREIQNYELNSLRSKIAFISQEIFIFKGSLLENLKMGRGNSLEDIKRACLESKLLEHMALHKWNWNKELLENGVNLSEGEKQLIALTRIFLQKPRLLILDEATSNMDTHTEEQFQKALERLKQNCTSITVAHRLQTLNEKDRIIAFRSGKIVETGSSKELLEKASYYKELYENSYKNNFTKQNHHPAL